VEAFRKALGKAQEEAASANNRSAIEQVLVENVGIEKDTAAIIHLGAYPTSLDPNRLQRIPDLMKDGGALPDPFDIKSMML
jgi:NitT/TauT family transport system substrate-binding protein